MKQVDLARKTGISSSRLGNYLQGTREPGLEDFGRLASALGVTSDWLLFGGTNRPVAQRGASIDIESLPKAARRDIEGYIRIVNSMRDKDDA